MTMGQQRWKARLQLAAWLQLLKAAQQVGGVGAAGQCNLHQLLPSKPSHHMRQTSLACTTHRAPLTNSLTAWAGPQSPAHYHVHTCLHEAKVGRSPDPEGPTRMHIQDSCMHCASDSRAAPCPCSNCRSSFVPIPAVHPDLKHM